MDHQTRGRHFKAAGQTTHSHDRVIRRGRIRGLFDQSEARVHVVVGEDLSDSFGHAETGHHKKRRRAFFPGPQRFRGQVRQPPVIAHDRL